MVGVTGMMVTGVIQIMMSIIIKTITAIGITKVVGELATETLESGSVYKARPLHKSRIMVKHQLQRALSGPFFVELGRL